MEALPAQIVWLANKDGQHEPVGVNDGPAGTGLRHELVGRSVDAKNKKLTGHAAC